MEQTPQTAVTTGPRAGEALSVRRLFTQAGVHPFESVEWETRDARIAGLQIESDTQRVTIAELERESTTLSGMVLEREEQVCGEAAERRFTDRVRVSVGQHAGFDVVDDSASREVHGEGCVRAPLTGSGLRCWRDRSGHRQR